MSCAIDAMKGLSLGGPVAEPLMLTIAWSVGITAVFLWPAVIGSGAPRSAAAELQPRVDQLRRRQNPLITMKVLPGRHQAGTPSLGPRSASMSVS